MRWAWALGLVLASGGCVGEEAETAGGHELGGGETTGAGASSAGEGAGGATSGGASSAGGAGAETSMGGAASVGGGAPAPEYPAPAPSSFHFVYQSSLTHWDAIATLSASYPNVAFVAKVKPPQIGPERWAAYLSYRDDPQPTAEDIDALLSDPINGPRYVMIEELHDAESEAYFAALATQMKAQYPQWAGRWGAFVGFGNYPVWADALDALLEADAMLSLELYPSQSEYCAAGANGGERDIWLAERFTGNASFGRLNWLLARKSMHGSSSFVSPLFGVGDVLLDGQSPAVFMDRLFYVWVTRTGQPSMINAANGGPGAYKWQDVADTPLGYGVGNTSRDLAFAESFQHYSVEGKTTSRLGPVPCN